MAIGIVAAVALPLLAMLAGGGSMQVTARSRETAARIAREAVASISPAGDQADWFWQPSAGDRILLSASAGREGRAYAAFDAEGAFLGEVDESGWRDGASPGMNAVHLLRLGLSDPREGPGSSVLLDLEVIVAQPAVAAESSRSEERFTSRLAAP